MYRSVKAAAKRDLNRLQNKRKLSSKSSRGSDETAVVLPKSAVDFTRRVRQLLLVSPSGPVRPCGMFFRLALTNCRGGVTDFIVVSLHRLRCCDEK